MSWVDSPVLSAFEYFSGVMATCYNWAVKYAALFGTIGLVWLALKLILNREQVKNAWWDIFFKWLGFVLAMTFYPMLCFGMSSIGHEIGLNAGAGKTVVISELKKLKSACVKDLQLQKKWAEDLVDDIATSVNDFSFNAKFENTYNYEDFLNSLKSEVKSYNWSWSQSSEKKTIESKIKQYRENSPDFNAHSAATLAILNKILVERNLDGTSGDDLTSSYIDLDIFLKDADGNETNYISAAALLRLVALTATVMQEKTEVIYNNVGDSVAAEDIGFIKSVAGNIKNYFNKFLSILECFFCIIILFFATVFCAIQYEMTIIEYIIVTGLFAVFMPLMLFDGTKDIPKKFVPVLTAFLMKIIVMTLCLMFVFYIMVQMCVNEMKYDGGMNLTKILEVLLYSFLCFILTQNAPKIAQTIMTGQPQLSMGEAMQAVGSMGAGVALGVKGAKLGKKAGVGATKFTGAVGRKIGNGIGSGITKFGQIKNAVKGAEQGVRDVVSQNKGTFSAKEAKKLENRAARRALGRELVLDPLNNMKNGVAGGINNFFHNNSNKTAGSGGGMSKSERNPYSNPNRTFKTSRTADGKNEKFLDFSKRRANESSERAKNNATNYANKAVERKQEEKKQSDISDLATDNRAYGED